MDRNRIGTELVYLDLEGRKYPLVFNLGALIEIDKKYGYKEFIQDIKQKEIKAIKTGLKAGNKKINLKNIGFKDIDNCCLKIIEGIAKNMPEIQETTNSSGNGTSNMNLFELYFYQGIVYAGLSRKETLGSSIKELYVLLDVRCKLNDTNNKPKSSIETWL